MHVIERRQLGWKQFCLCWLRWSVRAFWVFVCDFGFERRDLDHARKHGCGLRCIRSSSLTKEPTSVDSFQSRVLVEQNSLVFEHEFLELTVSEVSTCGFRSKSLTVQKTTSRQRGGPRGSGLQDLESYVLACSLNPKP